VPPFFKREFGGLYVFVCLLFAGFGLQAAVPANPPDSSRAIVVSHLTKPGKVVEILPGTPLTVKQFGKKALKGILMDVSEDGIQIGDSLISLRGIWLIRVNSEKDKKGVLFSILGASLGVLSATGLPVYNYGPYESDTAAALYLFGFILLLSAAFMAVGFITVGAIKLISRNSGKNPTRFHLGKRWKAKIRT
jgi:hypothetical protein